MSRLIENAFVVIALVLPGLLLGCGSSSSESTTAASGEAAPTKVAYIRRADRICQQNYLRRGQFLTQYQAKYLKSPGQQPPQAQLEKVYVNELMPIFEEETEKLGELTPPKTGAAEAKKVLVELEEAIQTAKSNPAKYMQEGIGVAFVKAQKDAEDFGFKYCNRN